MERDSLATLPNLLSLSRLGFAAAFVLLKGRDERLLLIAAAGATDFLDGWIARRRGTATKWGALIDPVADRFFVFAAVCSLLFDDVISDWQYAALMFRDFFTAVGFIVARIVPALRGVTFIARRSGKVVTVLQLATLALIFLAPQTATPMLALVAATSVYSVADYTWALYRAGYRA